MRTTIKSCLLRGADALPLDVDVEMNLGEANTSFTFLGHSTSSNLDAQRCLRYALGLFAQDLPNGSIVIRMTTAAPRIPGAELPLLAMALGIAASDPRVRLEVLQGLLVMGKLTREGEIGAVKGVVPAAMLARERGFRGVLVPRANAHEALAVEGIEVNCAGDLGEVLDALRGRKALESAAPRKRRLRADTFDVTFLRDQSTARRAMEVAAAGGHHVMLTGEDGPVRDDLVHYLSAILPEMSSAERLETMRIYSAAGLLDDGLFSERPLRRPHWSIDTRGMEGGGPSIELGEASLAHNGVLYLQDLPAFAPRTISRLIESLKAKTKAVYRHGHLSLLPTAFQMVAAALPCPCGLRGSRYRECRCRRGDLQRYRKRMDSDLLSRTDVYSSIQPAQHQGNSEDRPTETLTRIRHQIEAALDRQRTRLAPWGLLRNAEMSRSVTREACKLDQHAEYALARLALPGRSLSEHMASRILRVARTIADLRDLEVIDTSCILESASYRLWSKPAAEASLSLIHSRGHSTRGG